MSASRILSADRVIVCDGAMGTMIHSKGVPLGQSFDEVNIDGPAVVEGIHKAYVEAGAEILETNTFGANRIKLENYGLSHKVRELNIAGARIAKRAAGDAAFVAGSVGPTGRLMQPLGPLDFDLAFEVYRDQITALCEGGVDLLIIETIQDLREAKAAMLAAKTVTEVPMICQMSFVQEGKSMMGTGPDTAAVVLSSFGADLVGTNCGTGPQEMLDAVRAMARVTSLGISAQPNAGLPRFFEGRLMYLTTPEYTADFAQRFVEAGAKVVGGCCGTTPEHIKAIAEAVKGLEPVKRAGDGLTRLASRTSVYEIGTGTPVLIGSRLGCPSLSEAAVREGFQAAQDEAERQFEQGARVIALECGADSEKAGAIRRLVELVQSACPGALYLVGSEPGPLEAALRAVEGRALASLSRPVGVVIDSLLPLAKRYGAAVLVQTQAEASAQDTPEESLRAARRVIQAAEQLGLEKTGILVEPGSLFTDEGRVNEDTLRALRLLKSDLKVGTAIEHKPGEPTGDVAVAALRRAFESGADVLIADPSSAEVQAALSGP